MTKVLLVCSGLGHVNRGYETFMLECFRALRAEGSLDVRLCKGAGPAEPGQISLWTLRRDGRVARLLAAVLRRGSYVVEQASFTASLIPYLVRGRPDVVYYCDPTIGKLLWYWRQVTGSRFTLVFQNGGPHPPPHRFCDHVQQVAPTGMTDALAAGHRESHQTLLPYALSLRDTPVTREASTRRAARRALGLPEDRAVVVSVGALNVTFKRMDYLVREVASLAMPRPFLVMLGQEEAETPQLQALATQLLGDGFVMRTVSRPDVDEYYAVADVFTLASLAEGFGLVYAEALAHGLPCLAHDYPVSRYVLGDEGMYADFRQPGALAALIERQISLPDAESDRRRRHAAVVARFDWGELLPRYVRLFSSVARHRPGAPARGAWQAESRREAGRAG